MERGRDLLLVTGSTRSGTSLMAGVLDGLGFHVPEPVLRPNASNPLGFFEPRWSVRFHKRILARTFVSQTDGRPEAFDLAAQAVTADDQARLRRWLERTFAATDRVVVKDPRIIWFVPLWIDAAAAIGATTAFVAMIRRPSEVVASRLTYYGSPTSETAAWTLRVRNLAAWINASIGVERQTRGLPRSIVRYDDLLADWRAVVDRLARETPIDVAADRGTAGPGVDALVRPDLNRHRVSWDGMGLPDELVRVADEVWDALAALAGGSRPDADASADPGRRLDAVAARYADQMRVARAIAYDVASARERAGRAAAERESGRGRPHRRVLARLLGPIRAASRRRSRWPSLSR